MVQTRNSSRKTTTAAATETPVPVTVTVTDTATVPNMPTVIQVDRYVHEQSNLATLWSISALADAITAVAAKCKTAQQKFTDLKTENEQLKKRIAELEQQVAATTSINDRRQA